VGEWRKWESGKAKKREMKGGGLYPDGSQSLTIGLGRSFIF